MAISAKVEKPSPFDLSVKGTMSGSPRKSSKNPVKATQDDDSSTSNNTTNALAKQCHCRLSKCLKLYCECFTMGEACVGCDCVNCHNTESNREERDIAVKQILSKNPQAFFLKSNPGMRIRNASEKRNVVNSKGCNCRRSGCLKKYCECYQINARCTESCGCIDCKNMKQISKSSNILSLVDPFRRKPVAAIGSVLKRKDIAKDFIPSEKRETGIVKFSRTLPIARHRFVEAEHFRQSLSDLLSDASLASFVEHLYSAVRREEENYLRKLASHDKFIAPILDSPPSQGQRDSQLKGHIVSGSDSLLPLFANPSVNIILKENETTIANIPDHVSSELYEDLMCHEELDFHRKTKDLPDHRQKSNLLEPVSNPELATLTESVVISEMNTFLGLITERADERVQMLKLQMYHGAGGNVNNIPSNSSSSNNNTGPHSIIDNSKHTNAITAATTMTTTTTTAATSGLPSKKERLQAKMEASPQVMMTPVKRIMYSQPSSVAIPLTLFPSKEEENTAADEKSYSQYVYYPPMTSTVPYPSQSMATTASPYTGYGVPADSQMSSFPPNYSPAVYYPHAVHPMQEIPSGNQYQSGVSAQDVDILSHFISRNQQK